MTASSNSSVSRPADEASSSMRLTLREWKGQDLDAGLQEWRALESRLSDVPMACSHLWTGTWLRVYRDLVSSSILTAEHDGRTVGACLVTRGQGQKAGPIPIRTLHIGTAGEPHGHSVCVEYNALLVDRPYRPALIAAVQTWLKSQSRVDEVRLDGWPADELTDWNWSTPANESRLRDCKYFDLDKSREAKLEPIELLGRSTRQNLRRLLRKYDGIETTWAESLDDADDIFTEMTVLHQARWNALGQPGAFASPRFEAFQRQLLVQGFDEQKIVTFRARHAGQTVGCLMLIVDRGRLLDYLSGFAPFDEKPSPGLVTHYLCLSEAARRCFHAYDFLVGDKRHKDNLSTDVRQLAWSTWRRRTLRNFAVDALKHVKKLRDSKKPGFSPDSQTVSTGEDHSPIQEAGLLSGATLVTTAEK
jgi:CelD/BcsL family acetyltransferase involved in cellulose biosynthesis